ncbi:MAG: hypothetical protein IPO81_05015 [Kouleothrix sp.]|nr:hypothetical protein [Kouleothrix sp.]
MKALLWSLATVMVGAGMWRWYAHEIVDESDATVHLQSEHEHFHLHVDLPAGVEILPGDTLEIVSLPKLQGGQTDGEITYPSRVRLFRASWLKRNLIKRSSMLEINELVEHP